MKLGRSALYPAAGTGMAAFVALTILSEWPEGDADGARQAAAVWRSLAGRLDANATTTGGVAERVWTANPSAGSEAFRAFWSSGGSGAPPGGVAAYPPQVSAYCRRVAEACEGYATAVETTKHALQVLSVISYTQLMFACSWPWVGARVTLLSEWLLQRLYKKVQATVLLKFLSNAVMKIVMDKLVRYTVGSATFALGDEALALGTKVSFGDDVGSFGDNASSTLKDFAACMVFFGVWDLTKVGPMTKVFRNNDAGDFASFYAGSSAYTVAYNVESGKTGTDVLPTMSQLMSKLLIGTAQRGKDPGYRPR
ncbi:WXG100-like domain-containing protein [Sphaerisporangium corydalis]|uniref:Outer membrane channel protein CpnT-like N-terminal domain-containing protein n=1 Tax=Sphaerisporangium corydalis TaxID=1441875 RepID=A0ABV9E723_9ACTN|nr:hypothetical protein [Sphaerisporangium corydalis]